VDASGPGLAVAGSPVAGVRDGLASSEADGVGRANADDANASGLVSTAEQEVASQATASRMANAVSSRPLMGGSQHWLGEPRRGLEVS
jgi:hypothetical protein